jgi:F5/8 type C domain
VRDLERDGAHRRKPRGTARGDLPAPARTPYAFAFKISPVDRAATIEESLTLRRTAAASDVHQNLLPVHGADKAVDGRVDTRWASESLQGSWLEVDLGKPATFDQVWIDEWRPIVGKTSDPGMSRPRIRAFELQYEAGGSWKTFYKGTAIGTGFRCFIDPVIARTVRLTILDGLDPAINEFHLFAPATP